MKKLFAGVFAFLVFSSVSFAETTPVQKYADRLFDKAIGLSGKYFNAEVVEFLKELKNDPAIDYKLYSFKPLVLDVYCASGKAISINYPRIDFVSANGHITSVAGVCLAFLFLGGFLLLIGLISLFPLFMIIFIIPGVIILFFTVIFCI